MPRFALPTISSHLRQVEAGTFMCDLDVGEMFLNFVLHPGLRPLTGVDLTFYTNTGQVGRLWECWQRAAMGLTSSPYHACQGMACRGSYKRRSSEPKQYIQMGPVEIKSPRGAELQPHQAMGVEGSRQ